MLLKMNLDWFLVFRLFYIFLSLILCSPMRDQEVRAAFHNTVLKSLHIDEDTQIIDELGLKNGQIRADIAVLNGKMVGYEIKTDKDNLIRLSSQVGAYSEVFDKAYIISGQKHLDKVLKCVPEWWGVFKIITDEHQCIGFEPVRQAISNDNQNAYTISQLLWKAEVVSVLQEQFNCVIKSSYTKSKLYEMLAGQCEAAQLSKIVLSILKNRAEWRTSRQQLS